MYIWSVHSGVLRNGMLSSSQRCFAIKRSIALATLMPNSSSKAVEMVSSRYGISSGIMP